MYSSDVVGWSAAVLLSLVIGVTSMAKDKEPAVEGKVFLIDKGNSTIMVDTANGARRLVVYRPDTEFRYGRNNKGKGSSLDQVEETQFISCTGKFDDSARLIAKECVHREQK
jgi:hypothetical protein